MKFIPTCIVLGIAGAIVWDAYTAPPSQSILSHVVTRVLTQAPAATPPVVKTDTSIQSIAQIKDLSELSTASTRVVAIADAESTQSFWVLGNHTTAKLTYLMVADVKVGIDLAGITPESIQVTDQSITIKLPAPKILSRQVDESKSQVVGSFELINNKDLEQKARQDATIKIEEEICKTDLFQRSNQQAVTAISNLLKATNQNKLITVTPGVVPQCQAQPSPPVSQ